MSMYAKCGELEIAKQLFLNIKDKDVVSWSSMIASFEQAGQHDAALSLFRDMMRKHVKPNSVTLTSVFLVCAGIGASRLGKSVQCYVAHALIDMFTKCDDLAAAKSLFDKRGFEKSVVSWNIMMNGYLLHGQAIASFRQMKVENFQPKTVTFVNILHALAQLAVLRVGKSVQANLIRFGFCSYTPIGNSLVDMYSKCGMVEYSERCFIEVRNKDMVSWNTMLSAYAAHGLAKNAISLFLFMQENKLKLDFVSFLSVLSACRHAGLVEEGKRMFREMEERHEIDVEVEH